MWPVGTRYKDVVKKICSTDSIKEESQRQKRPGARMYFLPLGPPPTVHTAMSPSMGWPSPGGGPIISLPYESSTSEHMCLLGKGILNPNHNRWQFFIFLLSALSPKMHPNPKILFQFDTSAYLVIKPEPSWCISSLESFFQLVWLFRTFTAKILMVLILWDCPDLASKVTQYL